MSPERRVSSMPSRSALSTPFYARNTTLFNALSSFSSAHTNLARQYALEHTLSQIHHAKLSIRSRHPKFLQLKTIYEEYVRQCELHYQKPEAHRQRPRPHRCQCQREHHGPYQHPSQASSHPTDTPTAPSPPRLLIPASPPASVSPSARSITDSGTDSAVCTRSLKWPNVRRLSYPTHIQSQPNSPMAYDRHTSAGILEHTPKWPSIRVNDVVKRPLSWQKQSAPAVAASPCAVHENVEQISYRLYRQRIRSRETSPYNSHPRVRSAEPQIPSSRPSVLPTMPDLVRSTSSPHSHTSDDCRDIVKQEEPDEAHPIGAIKREPVDEAKPLPSPSTNAGSSSPRDHRYYSPPVSRSNSRSSDSSHNPKVMTAATSPSRQRESPCQSIYSCCVKNAPASPHHPTARQEGSCPWGMPDLPPPIPHRRRRPQRHDEPSFRPNPGRVTMNSRAWTPDEKRALYLAATHSRLPHQWSRIRVMTNLHRSDQEIETEYLKLFEHRATTGPEDENEERGRTAARGQYDHDGHGPDDVDRGTDAHADADYDNKNERARSMGYYGGEPRLLSMDARARQLLRMSMARHRSQYQSAVSPRHGPPEPICVQHFQLEKIPLRI